MMQSIDIMVSAMEIYNKPNFSYRDETFCILATNAWELMLKAKIISNNNDKMSSIYIKKYSKNKDGTKSKGWTYAKNRSGNRMTISLQKALSKLLSGNYLTKACADNLSCITEIRDNAIHFPAKSVDIQVETQKLGAACVKNYVSYARTWFKLDLSKYNLYIMPLSFFGSVNTTTPILSSKNNAVSNVVSYIRHTQQDNTQQDNTIHSKTDSFSLPIRIDYSAMPAQTIPVRVTSKNDEAAMLISPTKISKLYPLDYNTLTNKLLKRYGSAFKINKDYHAMRKVLERDSELCYKYPQNPRKPDGAVKKLYSPKIISKFDKHYRPKERK